ncbi:hypothetical protein [Roseivirga sp. E12]|uniref:hypothetical protein n=1 Tax=Roseivirga sp. E12 TaxID=2819237 RepID=UPI001ABC22CA|nr:hypothetical protein [Roseivirga sp. E12]MBO3697865.1 hypothetical protein [Roseivirga sp. E12]
MSFKEHKVGNWYETSKLLDGRIAFKTINDYPEYTEVIEITEIIPREVSSSEFDLPQNKPIYASYQALDTQVSMMQVSQESFDCYSNKKGAAPIPSDGTTKHTSYVEMVVLKDGSLKVLGSLEEDPHGLYKVAIDIAKSCGFQFSAGKIGDEQVDSITYLPIEFSF